MCLIRYTLYTCTHTEIHKINHCQKPSSNPPTNAQGLECPNVKHVPKCRLANRSSKVCKIYRGACGQGVLSMHGVRIVVKAEQAARVAAVAGAIAQGAASAVAGSTAEIAVRSKDGMSATVAACR